MVGQLCYEQQLMQFNLKSSIQYVSDHVIENATISEVSQFHISIKSDDGFKTPSIVHLKDNDKDRFSAKLKTLNK